MDPAETGIVFMGSPEFAVPSLRALVAAGYRLQQVICQPDRPSGRGGRVQFGPVKQAALDLGIPVYQPETLKSEEVVAHIAALEPTAFVVAAYGKIIPRALLAIPSRGSVNVHASLLPRWRGASPIEASILAGDEETGVSIMEVVPKMDAGDVVNQARLRITNQHTGGILEAELSAIGADLLVRTMPAWLSRNTVPQPQDEAPVTYCPLIRKEDGALRASMAVCQAERTVRAYNPWPGAFAGYSGGRLTIWSAHVAAIEHGIRTGALAIVDGFPAIGFKDGWLVLDIVQKPGGKRQGGREFLNGERGRGALATEVQLS